MVSTRPDSNRGGGVGGFTGTSSQITLGDGTPADNVPAGAFDNLSAADIPDLDAAKITTGQLVDGRMPTASNAATIGAISTVANAALPKAGYSSGSAAMTGPLALTGTQTSAGNTITNIFRGSSGEATINSAWLNVGWNGVNYHTIGSTGWQLVSGTTGAGNSIANIFRNSGGGITSNAPTGGTHIATVNGARVGGFPLTPSDMPLIGTCEAAQTNSQTVSTSLVDLAYGTPSVNTIGTWSGSTLTLTAPNGWYLVKAGMFTSGSGVLGRVFGLVNGSIGKGLTSGSDKLGNGPVVSRHVYLQTGDAIKFQAIAESSITTSNANAWTSDLLIAGPFQR